MKRGTLSLSWGPWGGVYLSFGHCTRLCLGFVALTLIPALEIEDLMRAYINEAGSGNESLDQQRS